LAVLRGHWIATLNKERPDTPEVPHEDLVATGGRANIRGSYLKTRRCPFISIAVDRLNHNRGPCEYVPSDLAINHPPSLKLPFNKFSGVL
jgi:hypothetical protein